MACGNLHIIFGPMYSGKSKTLIETYNKHILNSRISIYQHSQSKHGNTVRTRNNTTELESILINDIKDIKYKYEDVILIDEFQFFNNNNELESIKSLIKNNVEVYIFGLISDYKGNPFGSIKDMIHIAASVLQLKTKCNTCNNINGIYSSIINPTDDNIIKPTANYIPLCAKCFLSK